MLGQIKVLCAVLVTAAHMIFMIGQYLAGAKLFAGLRPSDGSKPLSQTSPLFETSSPPGFPRPASIAPAARPSPSASPRQPSGRATECGTAGANAVCLATSTPLQTLTSTSPTSSAGSATTPTNLWQPISSKGSDSTPMSSCSPCGYLTSPRSPFGYASVGKELRRLRSIGWYEFYSSLPFPAHVPQRPGGDGAQVGAGQAPSAPPLDWVVRVLLQPPFSGSCTSTARGRRRTSWSRTGLRRTTEGNGPRAPTFDASGLQAISPSPRRADLWLRGRCQGLLQPACHGALGATQGGSDLPSWTQPPRDFRRATLRGRLARLRLLEAPRLRHPRCLQYRPALQRRPRGLVPRRHGRRRRRG